MRRSLINVCLLAVLEAVLVVLVVAVCGSFFRPYAISPWVTLGISAFFFLMDGGALVMSRSLLLKNSKHMVSFYLVSKVLRFLLSVLAVMAYLLAGGNHAVMFVIQMLLFYLATLLFTNACLVRGEAINK